MLLRWKLAVVLGGGAGIGHEVCLRLARSGAGVLVADPDLDAAETTAALARERRVSAWSLRVDPADAVEVGILAARCRDLGGADIVVSTGLERDRAVLVAGTVRPDLSWLEVAARGPDEAVAVDVLAALRAAEPGAAVLCL